jgi:hypothetical protein
MNEQKRIDAAKKDLEAFLASLIIPKTKEGLLSLFVQIAKDR